MRWMRKRWRVCPVHAQRALGSDGRWGRTVLFVNMGTEYIAVAKWQEFLEGQEKLLANRKKNTLAKQQP
ncbi:MAG TPA: hypothetical protein VG122_00115 [Gemmata sp.]|nr:hypothetical protein [Gemmata sp.]